MFGSNIIDLAMALALMFLFLSFMATAVREAIEAVMKSRAVYLECGIREILGDPTGDGIAKAFYEHPLIYSLFRGPFEHTAKRVLGRNMPTYIPAANFAHAVIDLAIRGPVDDVYAAAQVAPDMSVATLRACAARLGNAHLVRAVLTATDHAEGDFNKARENLQAWYDSAMDRVSGRYKRTTGAWLFAIGLVLAAMLNVNTLTVTNRLWHDKELRAAVVTRAEAVARDPEYQRLLRQPAYQDTAAVSSSRDLAALKLPIGWSDSALKNVRDRSTASVTSFLTFWFWTLAGFLPTALAVTLGAPFWFDALNKIMVIRSTVKPHQKSPEESSEDRQAGTPKTTSSVVVTGGAGGGGGGGGGGSSSIGGSRVPIGVSSIMNAAAAVVVGALDPDHAPHEWATGDPDEGVI